MANASTPRPILDARSVLVGYAQSPEPENVLQDRTFQGKPVKAFHVARATAGHQIVTPTKKLAEVIEETVKSNPKLRELLEKKGLLWDRIYLRENLTWSDASGWGGKETDFPAARDAWNKAEGDPNKAAELFGRNDWGEYKLDGKGFLNLRKTAEKQLLDKHGMVDPIAGAIVGRGRKSVQIDSKVGDSILNDLKALGIFDDEEIEETTEE